MKIYYIISYYLLNSKRSARPFKLVQDCFKNIPEKQNETTIYETSQENVVIKNGSKRLITKQDQKAS